MSKMTLKEIRDEMLPYVDGAGPYAEVRVVDLQEWSDALAERIAADEASVPVACIDSRHLQLLRTGWDTKNCLKHKDDAGEGDSLLYTHPPAQPPIDLDVIREVVADLRGIGASVASDGELADQLSRAIGDAP